MTSPPDAPAAKAPIGTLATLLLASGFCSLVYQVAWLRLLRLIFGASTEASAAVVAIFMGGLGIGGLVLGRRADRALNPLRLYSLLETGIAVGAALSPFLVLAVRAAYVGMGGTEALGTWGGTGLRLLLSAFVLAGPTFLMGGTLPAAVRAVEEASDQGRRNVGLLYGVNTLGAVLGAAVTTFLAIELLGIRKTVWVAALLNLLVAVAARAAARRLERPAPPVSEPTDATFAEPVTPVLRARAPVTLVLAAAALVGFVFFLMELVWYRMLAPILGGSSYTFGLILTVALAGIGVGGLVYGYGSRRRRPTLLLFAGTCALEALTIAVPYALGDRLALLALVLRSLGAEGFSGLVAGWAVVAGIVVLPASVVAGYQFPVLVGILGAGERRVGREVGLAYAWNTAGAIAGAIAGGFGLLSLLSAPGSWKLVVAILGGLSATAALRDGGLRRRRAVPLLVAAGALLLAFLATGPTAVWRHGGIGAGRMQADFDSPNALRARFESVRRDLVWETDGIESSVALRAYADYAFVVNGKSDGAARGDAPTQVMSGLVGAILHPHPESALVVGLGTGSSAGWLAAVPSIRRVDVVELEPAIVEVARVSAPVNRDALDNPKLHLRFGDAREVLQATQRRYDLIFSEPSNPYRAGVSSLFTRELYQAVADRLEPGGIFLQWLQGYEVDAQVVRTAYATLSSVFPSVESWQVHSKDLLLVASREPLDHDLPRISRRVSEEPFASALRDVWGVSGAAGFYAGYLADPAFAHWLAADDRGRLNTDDHPVIEYGFARNLGRRGLFDIQSLRTLAAARGENRPPLAGGSLDWSAVDDLWSARELTFDVPPPVPAASDSPAGRRTLARRAYYFKRWNEAVNEWFSQPQEPASHTDLVLVAHALAEVGDARAPGYVERLRAVEPTEAGAAQAIWLAAQGRSEEAAHQLLEVFTAYRTDPWPRPELLARAVVKTPDIARAAPSLARDLFAALGEPFAVRLLDQLRLRARYETAREARLDDLCGQALAGFEPHPPWELPVLAARLDCYRRIRSPLVWRAADDLQTFLDQEPPKLVEDPRNLPQPPSPPAPPR